MGARGPSLEEAGLGSLTGVAGAAPWAFFEQVRSLGDVVWDEGMSAWLVCPYDLLKQISREDQTVWRGGATGSGTFGDGASARAGMSIEDWKSFRSCGSTRSMHAVEGERHDRQHRWWMRTFSGRTVKLLGETLVRPVANAELDRIAGRGRAELYEDFAARIAPRVIAAAMGLPWQDDDWIAEVLAANTRRLDLVSRWFDPDRDEMSDALIVERGLAAVEELRELMRPYVEGSRAGTGDDFISLIWRDAEELFGAEFDDVDVTSTVIASFSGGSGTTSATTSAGLYQLMIQTELQEQVREGGTDAAGAFVEEVLRLYTPNPYRVRQAVADTELAGVAVAEGDTVIGLAHAANRDPSRYERPLEIDLARPAPRDHFSFGLHGPRSCPGQGLARTQLTTIFDVLLERVRDLRFDPAADPPEYTDSFIRRWRPLYATFTEVR